MNTLSGGTYKPLSPQIAAKKASINVKNPDNLCFLYSIIALKYPASDDVFRYTKYHKYITEFEQNEDDFPMDSNKIHFLCSDILYQGITPGKDEIDGAIEKDNDICNE